MILPLLIFLQHTLFFSSTQILPSKGSIDCTCSKLKAQAYLTRHDAQTLCRAFTRDLIAVLGNPFCPFTRIMEAKQTYADTLRSKVLEEKVDVGQVRREGCIQVGKMTLRKA